LIPDPPENAQIYIQVQEESQLERDSFTSDSEQNVSRSSDTSEEYSRVRSSSSESDSSRVNECYQESSETSEDDGGMFRTPPRKRYANANTPSTRATP
jgi:hypothetical protein